MKENTAQKGKKYDQEKVDWSLVPYDALEETVKVLQMGAEKYGRYNWKGLSNYYERYFAAAMRHMVAWKMGEMHDEESGLNHLAHAAVNMLFLLYKDLDNKYAPKKEVNKPKRTASEVNDLFKAHEKEISKKGMKNLIKNAPKKDTFYYDLGTYNNAKEAMEDIFKIFGEGRKLKNVETVSNVTLEEMENLKDSDLSKCETTSEKSSAGTVDLGWFDSVGEIKKAHDVMSKEMFKCKDDVRKEK